MKQIILASTSPRRKQLLAHLGLPFKVVASNYHEVHHKHLTPVQLVKFLAEGKAQAVARHYRSGLIIGADTIVIRGKKIYHKPCDRRDAVLALKELSGRTHYVYTGVTVIDAASGKKISRAVQTKVHCRKLNKQGIENYLNGTNFLDKAGAYAVQEEGAGVIKKIEGDYTNVVGLPLDTLRSMLRKFGIN